MNSKRIREITIVFALAIIAVVIVVGITASKEASSDGKSGIAAVEGCFPELPDRVEFADEAVPLDDPEVRERLDRELITNVYYHSSTIQAMKLAGRWFPIIEEVLERNGIPEDLKYLAVAESGLRNVVSPANAEGVWQILAGTARDYGLTVTDDVDQRYDVELATEAAAQYLKEAHERFGSWALAAASYNMGRAGIASSLEAQGVDSYYDLLLNSETSRYVFRIVALKLIMENPEKYGYCFDPEAVYEPVEYETVEVTSSIPDLIAFARQHNTTLKTIKYLNPWLRGRSLNVAAGESYTVKIPE